MLIRSQNKEVLVAFESLPDIEVSGGVISARRDIGWRCLLGEYSTKEKAMKVLDMIQEVYEESQLPVIISALLFTDASAVDELKKELSNEKLKNRFVFQMPADSEVVV
jgi:hypothetical protein